MEFIYKQLDILRRALIVGACILLSSCVSSSLQTAKPETTTPTSELALNEEEREIRDSRAQAIAQIHAKADAYPENTEAPAYGEPRAGETPLLTPAQIAAKTNSMSNLSAKSQTLIPDAEILAKQREIAEMRRKGSTHYDSALKKIRESKN